MLGLHERRPAAVNRATGGPRHFAWIEQARVVALAFPYFPTVAALQSMMEANGGDDENVWIRPLNPDFQRQVEHYVAAGDDVYKKDFGFAWTKLMTSNMFDGPIHRTGMKE